MKLDILFSCGIALAIAVTATQSGCGSDSNESDGTGAAASTNSSSNSGGSNSGGNTSQGGAGGMATGGAASGGAATGGNAAGGTTGSGGMASGGSGGSAQGGSGGAPPKLGPVIPSLDKHNFYANCQSQVPLDPINGSFSAKYDNSKGATAGNAKVTSSKLTMTSGNQKLVWSFPVVPLTSGIVPAGMASTVSHNKPQKPNGTGQGDGSPCNYCKEGEWSLEVQWETGGKPAKAQLGPSKVSCVY